ncbi:MAG TPA: hypothetical protein VMV82_06095 [Candidatus Dormibacteraeota bacterium]|nr:hypothetical protein [Candidatus Dormibacteraeota bacterium]
MEQLIQGLIGTIVGGLISAAVAFVTLRGSLGNQLQLEERKFEYRKQLEAREREHRASAFQRKLVRTVRRLHNTSRMDAKARVSVPAWKRITKVLEGLLESDECAQSLDDTTYEAVWKACDESQAATMFLETWTGDARNPAAVVLLSLAEYSKALEACFVTLGDKDRARNVHDACAKNFKGVGFCMTDDYDRKAAYPNP